MELMPVAEHPFGGSWGYQVGSYYAPTARFGHPDDFRFLVDHLHQRGHRRASWTGCPATSRGTRTALGRFDGTALYEHADPRQGEQPDWGTYVFNFGRNEVRNFLVANALFWLEQYHVDGLRVDAVASMLYLDYSRKQGEWVPNRWGGRENEEAIAFLRELNDLGAPRAPRRDGDRRGVHRLAQGDASPCTRAGWASTSSGTWGGCTTRCSTSPRTRIYRQHHHNQLTFGLLYAFSEHFVLPLEPRRGGAREGLALREDAGRRVAEARQPARAATPGCGPTRARSCSSWAASSASPASGTTTGAWTGTCSQTRPTPGSRRWSGR